MARISLLQRLLVFYGTRLPNHPRKWWVHHGIRKRLGERARINRELEVERGGLRWSLNPADHAHDNLFWLGTKDKWELYHLKRHLQPGSVILDVGANFGYYALNLAAARQERHRVFALEPDPLNFARLRRNITGNGLGDVVQADCLGVADHPEVVTMSRHPRNSGHTAVVPDGEVQGVSLTTLDAFCQEKELARLDALILDVEGLEERALQGASQVLSRLKPLVLVELFPPVMERQGSSPEAVARILTGHGYNLFTASRSRLEPLTALPTGDEGKNVFAFPEKPSD